VGDGDEAARPRTRAIVDASLKALAFDFPAPPLVCDQPAAAYERASDEHGRLGITGATNRLGLGDKIRPRPPATATPTVNPLRLVRPPSATTASNSSGPITARGAVY